MKMPTVIISVMFFHQFTSQVVSPIATTGYNLDAIAENTTALANTGGAIDGSDYVMYSQAYGALYSSSAGLPNSGLISSGTRTYQLQAYNGLNVLYLLPGQMDTIVLTTPAPFGALSMLSFATEGSASMNLTPRFTDNTTQQFNNLSVPDWFNTGNVVTSGFDRCGRNSGNPNFQTTQPKMYYNDLILTCANRQKNVAKIIVHNSGSSGRLCVMAVSGIAAPVFSVSVTPVSCSGGNNGSATISVAGGLGPFSYTTATSPAQYNSVVNNLATGIYSYTAQDAGVCPVTATFAVTQSLSPQPQLTITPQTPTVCAGSTVALHVTGAVSYTWSPVTFTGSSIVVQPSVTTLYTVSGLTSQNCLRTGNVIVLVSPLPQITIQPSNTLVCENGPCVPLNFLLPQGGTYSGPGVSGNTFCPAGLPDGTVSINYFYSDGNGCSANRTLSFSVAVTPIPTIAAVAPVCANAPAFTVVASPAGGIFSGQGISASGIVTPSAAGIFPISYTVFNAPCKASSGAVYTVYSLTPVTFTISKNFFCPNSASVPMNAMPSTGSYSGPGVNGAFFSPASAGAGTHTITYSYTNSFSCTSTAAKTVTVSTCTGLGEKSIHQINVFPNPSDGEFSVISAADLTFLLYNQLGQVVRQLDTKAGNASVSGLTPGVYILLWENMGIPYRQKLVVRD